MKKLFSILIAATVLAAPVAQAQSRHDDRPGHRVERTVTTKKVIIKKHRWDRGQRWVRVNNQYLLINTSNGLIIGLSGR